jgi:hypothetical protein
MQVVHLVVRLVPTKCSSPLPFSSGAVRPMRDCTSPGPLKPRLCATTPWSYQVPGVLFQGKLLCLVQ